MLKNVEDGKFYVCVLNHIKTIGENKDVVFLKAGIDFRHLRIIFLILQTLEDQRNCPSLHVAMWYVNLNNLTPYLSLTVTMKLTEYTK